MDLTAFRLHNPANVIGTLVNVALAVEEEDPRGFVRFVSYGGRDNERTVFAPMRMSTNMFRRLVKTWMFREK